MHRFFAGLSTPSSAPAPAPAGPSPTACSSGDVPEQDGFHVFAGRTIVVDLATQVHVRGREELFEGREWLEEQLRHRRPVGFDMEWRPDREKDSDNAVALMQIADADTALLLRTHQTGRWLPQIVKELLTSPFVKKICVGYDGADRRKLESSFGFLLSGVVELAELAPRKGLPSTGLKRMADDLGWHMRKESRTARSDWQAPRLTDEQVRYAAEDAYFTFKIFAELEERPDLVPEDVSEEDPEEQQSALSLKPGWAEQGVVRRNDGLWCELCKKGPMLRCDVMVRHLESRSHLKRARVDPEPEAAPAEEVPEELAARGIARGGGAHGRALASEYLCALCDAGPFQTLDGAQAHLRGRQHLKRERGVSAEPEELTPELEAMGVEVCEEPGTFRCNICDAGPFLDLQSVRQHTNGRQHQKKSGTAPAETAEAAPAKAAEPAASGKSGLQPEDVHGLPGYVDFWEGELMCCLCACKANNLQTMVQHLCSEKHSKVCRKSGRPELLFVQDSGRLEELETGRPVDRSDEVFDEDFVPPPPRPPPGPAVSPALQKAPRASSSDRRRVHFEDEAPKPRLEAPARPCPKDLATARAWSCWSGRARKASSNPRFLLGAASEGRELFARVEVTVPPPGWVWDASTCLALSYGEAVRVLHVDGEWIYGQCGDTHARLGWLPAWVLGPNPAEAEAASADEMASEGSPAEEVEVGPWTDAGTGGSAPSSELLPGRVLRACVDLGVPAGWAWDPASILRAAAGEAVEVLASEGEWLYGRSGSGEGWLPRSAVRPGDSDGAESPEVAASSGEAAYGEAGGQRVEAPAAVEEDPAAMRPGALRRRLEEAGVAIPLGVLEKRELVALLRAAEGTGREAAHVADNDSEASTAPTSTCSAGQDDLPAADGLEPEAVAGDLALSEGQVVRAREAAKGAPEGFGAGQFLQLKGGDEVELRYLGGGWAWGLANGCSGWVRGAALGGRGAAPGGPAGRPEGSLLRAERPVTAPPSGLAAANFLFLATGDAVLVEQATDDGWVWGFAGGHRGWAPAAALRAPPAPQAPLARSEGFTLRALRRVAAPPEGMESANFLFLEPGDKVHVEHFGDDGWLWCVAGTKLGWAPAWAFNLSDSNATEPEQPAENDPLRFRQQPIAAGVAVVQAC